MLTLTPPALVLSDAGRVDEAGAVPAVGVLVLTWGLVDDLEAVVVSITRVVDSIARVVDSTALKSQNPNPPKSVQLQCDAPAH